MRVTGADGRRVPWVLTAIAAAVAAAALSGRVEARPSQETAGGSQAQKRSVYRIGHKRGERKFMRLIVDGDYLSSAVVRLPQTCHGNSKGVTHAVFGDGLGSEEFPVDPRTGRFDTGGSVTDRLVGSVHRDVIRGRFAQFGDLSTSFGCYTGTPRDHWVRFRAPLVLTTTTPSP